MSCAALVIQPGVLDADEDEGAEFRAVDLMKVRERGHQGGRRRRGRDLR